jgi:DNA primase
MEDGCSAKFLFVPDGDDPDSLIRREGQEKFEVRIGQALGLTDFFFQTLGSDLDLESVEGRAALSKLSVPLIAQVSEGVFKQLMIQELSRRTGVDSEKLLGITGLDRSSPTRERLPPVNQRQRQLKQSGLGEHATRILLRQPDVANLVDDVGLAKLDGVTEWQLLVELVRWVQQAKDTSPMLLLSHYQDGPYFDYLRGLAEQDPMLSQDQLADEFLDTLRKMVRESESEQKQRVIDGLKQKPLSELSPAERELLTNYRRSKPQS